MPGDQAGDTIALHLDVVPDGGVPVDESTHAVVEVILDGVVRTPTAFPDDGDRSRWTALLTAAEAGLHTVRWTVTGTGAGVTTYPLPVGPAGPTGDERAYATTGQLARHLDAAPPVGAHRLLERASERVDELVRCAVYAVDEAGMPTDPAVAAALAEATCAQVEWWAETGDDTGTGAAAVLAGAQIGSVRLPSAAAGNGGELPAGYAPAARRALAAAGLTARGPLLGECAR